jgi:hypothetical protein
MTKFGFSKGIDILDLRIEKIIAHTESLSTNVKLKQLHSIESKMRSLDLFQFLTISGNYLLKQKKI